MRSFFFIISITICSYSFSQETVALSSENNSLQTILEILEKKYSVKFSYNPTFIKNIKVSIQKVDALEDILEKIELQTSLFFSKIDDRYYAIKKDANITICGYIVNKHEKPIPEALIYNHNGTRSVTSNQNGYFKLQLPNKQDTINIQFLGYKAKKLIATQLTSTNSECPKIVLTEDDFQLEEVLITEYLTTGISKIGVSGAIIIDPKKLGILPRLVEPDVLQSVQFLPGIQSPSETASTLHIRGGTPDQNLMLWDGIKMYSTGHFFDLISIFNPFITENIKVFRSSTEAKYGGRISGVVDIASKSEVPKTFGFGIGFNLTTADIYIEAPIDENFAFIISARRSFTDFIDTPTFKSYAERSFQGIRTFAFDVELTQGAVENKNNFYFEDLTLKMILNLTEKSKFSISSIFTNNDLNYLLNIKNITGGNQLYDSYQKDDINFVNTGISARLDTDLSPHFSYSINTYLSNYDLVYTGLRERRISSNNSMFYESNITEKNEVRDTGYSLVTNWKINNTHGIVSGYDFSTNKVVYNSSVLTYSFTGDEDEVSDLNESNNNSTHAIFGEYRYNYNEKVKVNTGIRGNYFSVLDKMYWEPRVQLEVNLNKNNTIKIAAERKNQVLSQVSFPNNFNIPNQIWMLSDSEFASLQSSNQLSTGFIIKKDNWYIDIEGYYKTTKGISSYANGFNGVLDLTTGGESKIIGLDFLIKKRIQDYRTWISYSITDQDFIFETINDGNSFSGNFDITHYASWVHSYQWNNFELSLGWNIRTGRPYTSALSLDTTGEKITYNTINSDRLDTYHRLDFSASYKFNLSKNSKWRSKIGFSLFNLYDQKNILNRTYAITNDNVNTPFLQEVNTISSGITPNLSYRIDF